jgi:hypothetical protein
MSQQKDVLDKTVQFLQKREGIDKVIHALYLAILTAFAAAYQEHHWEGRVPGWTSSAEPQPFCAAVLCRH